MDEEVHKKIVSDMVTYRSVSEKAEKKSNKLVKLWRFFLLAKRKFYIKSLDNLLQRKEFYKSSEDGFLKENKVDAFAMV